MRFWFACSRLTRRFDFRRTVLLFSQRSTNRRDGKPNEEHVRPAVTGGVRVGARQPGGRARARLGLSARDVVLSGDRD